MILSNRLMTSVFRVASVMCLSAMAISMTGEGAFAESVAAEASDIGKLSSSELTSAQKAGARGNLTDLFKSPRRLSTADAPTVTNMPAASVASLDQAGASEIVLKPVARGVQTVEQKRKAEALSALVAANAGPEALRDADPASRLGKIAAYRVKVLEVELLKKDLAEARKVLNALDLPEMSVEELTAQLSIEAEAKTKLQIEIAQIETGLDAVGGVNAELEADLIEVKASLAAQNELLLRVAADKNAAGMFDRTMKLVQMAEGDLAQAQSDAFELLEAASNKPVTGEVVAEVHRLLKLPVIE